MARADFKHAYGDTFHGDFVWWVDAAQTVPRDLTGCTVRCIWEHIDTGQTLTATITVTDAADGEFDVDATYTQMEIPLGLWKLDFSCLDGAERSSSDVIYAEIVEAVSNAH